jgi:hypothetical protein
MTSRDFAMMVAYNEIEPWVESYGEYHRAGIIASAIHNSIQLFVDKKKRKVLNPEDFMPKWEESEAPMIAVPEEDPESAAEALFRKASMIFMALGGRKERD